jgi:hypothetical protein
MACQENTTPQLNPEGIFRLPNIYPDSSLGMEVRSRRCEKLGLCKSITPADESSFLQLFLAIKNNSN